MWVRLPRFSRAGILVATAPAVGKRDGSQSYGIQLKACARTFHSCSLTSLAEHVNCLGIDISRGRRSACARRYNWSGNIGIHQPGMLALECYAMTVLPSKVGAYRVEKKESCCQHILLAFACVFESITKAGPSTLKTYLKSSRRVVWHWDVQHECGKYIS